MEPLSPINIAAILHYKVPGPAPSLLGRPMASYFRMKRKISE